VALSSSLDLSATEAVRRSILNYGLPDTGHRTSDDGSLEEIKAEIVDALRLYEPRLLAETIQIERAQAADAGTPKVGFRIHADLLCNPAPIPVELVAELELDTGKITVGKI